MFVPLLNSAPVDAEDGNLSVRDNEIKRPDICNGILYTILTLQAEDMAREYLNLFTTTQYDNFKTGQIFLRSMIMENFERLTHHSMKRLFLVLAELLQRNVPEIDTVFILLFRFLPLATFTDFRIWYIKELVNLCHTFKQFVMQNDLVMKNILYSFLTLLPAQRERSGLQQLLSKQVSLVIEILNKKDKIDLLLKQIGRDIIRVLQQARNVNFQINQFYMELLGKPELVNSILGKPTSKRILVHRLSPKQELKLHYIMTKIKLGNEKRYQDWFFSKFIRSKEDHGIFIDAIRFICTVFYPSNQQIAENYVPRYAMIGWIVASIMKNSRALLQKAMDALLFDFYCFNKKVDSIMNIEPAVLLIERSLRPELVHMSEITLHHLFARMRSKIQVPGNEKPNPDGFLMTISQISANVVRGFEEIMKVKVIRSLDMFYANEKIRNRFGEKLRFFFPRYIKGASVANKMNIPKHPVAIQQQQQQQQVNIQRNMQPPVKPVSPKTGPSNVVKIPGLPQIKQVVVDNRQVLEDQKLELEIQALEDEQDEPVTRRTVAVPITMEEYKTNEFNDMLARMVEDELIDFSVHKPEQNDRANVVSTIDDVLKEKFEPYLGNFLEFIQRKNRPKCKENLLKIIEIVKTSDDLPKKLIKKVSSCLINVLIYEIAHDKASNLQKLLSSLIFMERFLMFDFLFAVHKHVSVSENNTTGIVAKKKFGLFLRNCMKIDKTVGYRVFLYCVRRRNSLFLNRTIVINQVYANGKGNVTNIANEINKSLLFPDQKTKEVVAKDESLEAQMKYFAFYRWFLSYREKNYNEDDPFLFDMANLSKTNSVTFIVVLPIVTKYFRKRTVNNISFIHTLVANAYPRQINDICLLILSGDLHLLDFDEGNGDFMKLLDESSTWEYFQVNFFMDVFTAEFNRYYEVSEKEIQMKKVSIFRMMEGVLGIVMKNNGKNKDILFRMSSLFVLKISKEDFSEDFFSKILALDPGVFFSFTQSFIISWIELDREDRKGLFEKFLLDVTDGKNVNKFLMQNLLLMKDKFVNIYGQKRTEEILKKFRKNEEEETKKRNREERELEDESILDDHEDDDDDEPLKKRRKLNKT